MSSAMGYHRLGVPLVSICQNTQELTQAACINLERSGHLSPGDCVAANHYMSTQFHVHGLLVEHSLLIMPAATVRQ